MENCPGECEEAPVLSDELTGLSDEKVNDIVRQIDEGKIALSSSEKRRVRKYMQVEFREDELEDQVLETFAHCADQLNVSHFFFARKDPNKSNATHMDCSSMDPKE